MGLAVTECGDGGGIGDSLSQFSRRIHGGALTIDTIIRGRGDAKIFGKSQLNPAEIVKIVSKSV
jgi:hypothetical protein